jgi:hypothetical protein
MTEAAGDRAWFEPDAASDRPLPDRGGVHARRRDHDDGGDRGPVVSSEFSPERHSSPRGFPSRAGTLGPTIDPHTVIRDRPHLPPVQPQLDDSGQSVIQELRIRTMQTEQVVLDRGGA